MRFIFGAQLLISNGEYKVIRRPRGESVGVISMTSPKRAISVVTVVRNLVESSWHHIYVTAILGGDVEPGLYHDADNKKISWIVQTSRAGFDGPLPSVRGFEGLLMPWAVKTNRSNLPIDAVIGIAPYVAQSMSLMMSTPSRRVPGIARHETNVDLKGVGATWGRPGKNKFHSEVIAGTSLGVKHIFLSNVQRKNYFNVLLKNYLSRSSMSRMMVDSEILTNGVNLEAIDEAVGELKWKRGRTVGSFYRLTAEKGSPQVIELYSKLLASGEIDSALVTSAKNGSLDSMTPFGPDPGFEFTGGCGWGDYLRVASRAAVAMFNSPDESGPLCPLEVAYTGCVPLFPDKPWVRSTVGESGWEFIYKNMDEAVSMIRYVLNNHEEAGKSARKFVVDHYDNKERGSQFMQSIAREAESCNRFCGISDAKAEAFVSGSKIADSIRNMSDMSDGKPIPWSVIRKKIYMPRDRTGNLVVASWHDVPRLLGMVSGLVDDMESPLPLFSVPS